MVPLLLSLLLLESLADKVCVNISNSGINTVLDYANIFEDRYGNLICSTRGLPCIFQCTFSSWFNGSSSCLEINVTKFPTEVVDITKQNETCIINLCEDENIVPLVELLYNDTSHQKEMMQLFYIRDSCAQLFSNSHNVARSFIKVEKQIIHNIMRTAQLETGDSIQYYLKTLFLNVVNLSDAELNSTEDDSTIQIKAPQLPQNKSFVPDIWLPVFELRTIPKDERIIGLVTYMSDSQFQFEQENFSSMLIRIELLGKKRLHNLKTPITMIFKTFTMADMDNDSWLECRYFDEHDDYVWKTDGCETYNRTNSNQTDIICNCDHTTPFAVLMMRESISEVHWEILSYISYIGCGLSAFFTALSLVIYVFSRNHRMDYSISIHVSLSVALLLLNTTFLLTEWGATVKSDWVCVFVAAFMHYSLLCCFTWMAIEALHLYLLLIKVFNTYYKHYLLKLSLAGWGIPGIIVAVSLGVKDFKQFYGVTPMIMADTNQTSVICWITDDSFFYSLNLVYFTLIFIFNSGILMVVASSICKMKRVARRKPTLGDEGKIWRDPERFTESCKSGLTVLGLTCLMGTTWGLAFLGSGYVNYPILYLFCILNSTQGFFIFLWICLSTKKQRKKDMEDRMTSTPVKTSGIKSD